MNWLYISFLVILFFVGFSMNYAFGQTVETIGTSSTSTINGTQVLPVFIPPQSQQTGQTDQTGMYGLISLIVTGIALPVVTKMLKDKDEKTKEQAHAENYENEFRLKATASALKAQSQSLEETDKSNLELAQIIKVLFKPFKDNPEAKKYFDQFTYKGIPVLDALDRFIAESENDLEEYYKSNNLPQDDFDTCKDQIVQQVTAVRNKSRKVT